MIPLVCLTQSERSTSGESPHLHPFGDILAAGAVRPEIEVLLCCARVKLDTAVEERLTGLLRESLNWDVLYTAASRHGLLPLLFHHLSGIAGTANTTNTVPPHVLNEFRREFEENAARSFFLTAEMLRLLSLLREQGIQAAAYKGPALAMLAYGSLLLRRFCDLDLLIEAADLPRLHRLLEAQGYSQQFHSHQQSNEYAHSFVRHFDDESSVVIEVHWSITPRNFALPPHPPGAMRRLFPLSLNGKEVLTLSLEDQLLVLCWHGYKHHWSRLEWIACISEIVRHYGQDSEQSTLSLDWDELLALAKRAGSVRLLFCGLGLASALLEAPLPERIQSAMTEDRVLPTLVTPLCESLLRWRGNGAADGDVWRSGERGHESRKWGREIRFYHLRSRERLRDKLRYGWRTVLLPNVMDWRGLYPAHWRNRR